MSKKFETVEEFLARGGQIEICEPGPELDLDIKIPVDWKKENKYNTVKLKKKSFKRQ